MTPANGIRNESLSEYVRLLLQLHHLYLEGKSQTEAANTVRDQMYAPWKNLDDLSAQLVDDLSADLYTIGQTHAEPKSFPSHVFDEVMEALERNDAQVALQFVREHELELPAFLVANFRGMAWAGFGQHDVAAVFFEEAVRLQPNQPDLEICLLSSLLAGNRAGEAIARAESLAAASDPARLLMAANVFFARTSQLPAEESMPLHRRAIEVAQRGLQMAQHAPPDVMVKTLRPGVLLHMALSYKQLGDVEAARQACRQALSIDPDNVDALILDDWLNCKENDFAGKFHRRLFSSDRMAFRPRDSVAT